MALSAFEDKTRHPEPAELRKVLGKSAALWERLISQISEKHAPITEQWSFSGAKWGWSLRLKRKDRVVLYMTPQTSHFVVGVVLGENWVEIRCQRVLVRGADVASPVAKRLSSSRAPRLRRAAGSSPAYGRPSDRRPTPSLPCRRWTASSSTTARR